MAEFRELLRINSDNATAHYNYGIHLKKRGKLKEAISEYAETIRLNPEYAEAHCNLGDCLQSQGDYAGSLAMYRRGHELGSRQPGWRYPSAQWVANAERMAGLAIRLPALLKGDDRPKEIAERLALAQMCYDTKRYAAAARFWAEALDADPTLGDDRQAVHRYDAACAAALAAAGQGKDEPPPDDSAKARLQVAGPGLAHGRAGRLGEADGRGRPEGAARRSPDPPALASRQRSRRCPRRRGPGQAPRRTSRRHGEHSGRMSVRSWGAS